MQPSESLGVERLDTQNVQDIKVYVDIQIREIRVFYTLPDSHYICKKDLNEL